MMRRRLGTDRAEYARVVKAGGNAALYVEGTQAVTDGMKVLLTNPVTKFPAINVRTEGAANTATSGYVQVTVDKWAATPTETVNAWIPVIIVFAMVGMALELMRRLSK